MKKSGLADSPFFTNVTLESKDAALLPDETLKPEMKQKPAEPALPTQEKPLQEKPAKEETLRASMHARKHANMHATIQASMLANMQPYLSEKATNTFAFRYPPDLLEKMADVLYQIRKQHHRKLTKNAIAVAALTFLLTDFEIYGEESVLYQLLIKSDS